MPAKRIATPKLACLAIVASLFVAAPVAHASAPAADCQPFSGAPCLLPFPSNLFTRPDKTSATGVSPENAC